MFVLLVASAYLFAYLSAWQPIVTSHRLYHEKFFQLLSSKFDINGCALDWFKTYFTNRTQSVIIDGHESEPHTPLEGVPQGSVIRPLSFTLYSSPLETIIESHGIGKMIYADDTQVYVVLNGDNTCKWAAISKLELCVKGIKAWSTANYLKLNEDKTEVLHIKSRFQKPSVYQINIQIGGPTVESTSCALNLGVQFEDNLDKEDFEDKVWKNMLTMFVGLPHSLCTY